MGGLTNMEVSQQPVINSRLGAYRQACKARHQPLMPGDTAVTYLLQFTV